MQIVHVLHNLCARRIGATLKHGLYPGGIVSRVSDWELDRFQFPYDDTSRTELKERKSDAITTGTVATCARTWRPLLHCVYCIDCRDLGVCAHHRSLLLGTIFPTKRGGVHRYALCFAHLGSKLCACFGSTLRRECQVQANDRVEPVGGTGHERGEGTEICWISIICFLPRGSLFSCCSGGIPCRLPV